MHCICTMLLCSILSKAKSSDISWYLKLKFLFWVWCHFLFSICGICVHLTLKKWFIYWMATFFWNYSFGFWVNWVSFHLRIFSHDIFEGFSWKRGDKTFMSISIHFILSLKIIWSYLMPLPSSVPFAPNMNRIGSCW